MKRNASVSLLSRSKMGLFAVAAAAICALGGHVLAADGNKIAANWIWAETAGNGQAVYFRKTIELPAQPKSAALGITCDNHCEVFVNGVRLGKSDNWERPLDLNVTAQLKAGKNVIAVRGVNDGDKAGLVAVLRYSLDGKTTVFETSDKTWKLTEKPTGTWSATDYNDGAWTPAKVQVGLGGEPWGDRVTAPALTGGKAEATPAAPAAPAGPPDPVSEQALFKVADGFEISLYAASPDIAKPIQMNFDADGKLWVVSSATYPQIKPGEVADDKVVVLEDKDGDGRAEKSTVFARGLLIPTGIEVGDGGAYVANSTEMVHFKDTNGDGVADERRVVLSGFGTEDTHHIIHTFRYGENGLLYFNQSIYIHSHLETPNGTRRLNGGGIWRFRPSTMELNVFMRGLVNTWGQEAGYWGEWFGTDGAGGEGVNYLVDGAYYTSSPGAPRVLPGLNPGSPKFAGMEIVSGRHLPDDWQQSIITNDFRAHRIARFVIAEAGSGFTSTLQPDVIKTPHASFRPIDVKMGPDGAIYIADWFNPIINHGEVDFRDPRRDHVNGRIWRLTAKGRPLVARPQLTTASTPDLLEQLKAPEQWTRHFAKRVLVTRDAKTVAAELAKWVAGLKKDDPQYEHNKLEALWTYQTIDVFEPNLLNELLNATDGRVRAAAVHALNILQPRVNNSDRVIELLTPRVTDAHPRVRLEAVRCLATIPGARSAELAAKVLDLPMDKFLDYGLRLMLQESQGSWRTELESGKLTFGGSATQLEYVRAVVGSKTGLANALEQLLAGHVAPEVRLNSLPLVMQAGGPTEYRKVFGLVFHDRSTPVYKQRLLDGLLKAFRARGMAPDEKGAEKLTRLETLFAEKDPEISLPAIQLAGAWKVEGLRAALTKLAGENSAGGETAANALAELGGAASVASLNTLAATDANVNVKANACSALAKLDSAKAAASAAGILSAPCEYGVIQKLVGAFMRQKGGAEALSSALKEKKIPADNAKLSLRASQQNAGAADSPLNQALAKAGGIDAEPAPPTREMIVATAKEALEKGVAAKGREIFMRETTACSKCHRILGIGGQVGPDLSSIGTSAPPDYLVESLYMPDKAIKEGFHAVIVFTKGGEILTGIKVRDGKDEIVLRDATAKDIVIKNADIEKQRMAGTLMPSGLMDNLTRQEVLDLVKYLSELGKAK